MSTGLEDKVRLVLDVAAWGCGGGGESPKAPGSEGRGLRAGALTEQQDDTGQHDGQGAQADARAPCPQRSSPP